MPLSFAALNHSPHAIPQEVIAKVFVDTSLFARSLEERPDEYRKIAARARERGAIHHRFAVGDGFVLVNDEWESAAASKEFSPDKF